MLTCIFPVNSNKKSTGISYPCVYYTRDFSVLIVCPLHTCCRIRKLHKYFYVTVIVYTRHAKFSLLQLLKTELLKTAFSCSKVFPNFFSRSYHIFVIFSKRLVYKISQKSAEVVSFENQPPGLHDVNRTLLCKYNSSLLLWLL